MGDANFIPADLVLEYKIRFENDPNATAPAQRVLIRHPLDDDVDERSFRVGSFGFGDFTQNVTVQRAFLQVGNTNSNLLSLHYFCISLYICVCIVYVVICGMVFRPIRMLLM